MDKVEQLLGFSYVCPRRALPNSWQRPVSPFSGMTREVTPEVLATQLTTTALGGGGADNGASGQSDNPALVLLSRGGCALRCGAAAGGVASPAVLLLPAGTLENVHLDADARGFIVALEEAFTHLMSAREPAFGNMFREARVLALESEDPALRSLDATICDLIRELQLAGAARQTAVDAYVQLLLTTALRLLERVSPHTIRPEGRATQLVRNFLNLTAAHGRHRWRLHDYAEALHVSAGHLRATCVQVTGAPPVQLIHESLIHEAKHRLLDTAEPVGVIARDLGFDDAAYFSRLFHAKAGCSATEFRVSSHRQAPPACAAIVQ